MAEWAEGGLTGARRWLAARTGTRQALAFLAPIPVVYLVFGYFWLGEHRLQADFTAFYTGAAMVAQGLGGRLYDLDLQRQVQAQIIYPYRFDVGGVLPYRNPPFGVLPLLPLATLPVAQAYYLWGIANLAWLLGSLTLLSRSVPTLSRASGLRALLWLASLAFLPTFSALLLGQMSFLVLFCFAAGFELLRRRRDTAAGAVLAVVAIKPQLLLVAPLLLAAKGRWRALMGMAAGTFGLGALSLLMVGPLDLPRFLETSRETAEWLPLSLDLTWSGFMASVLAPWPAAILPATVMADGASLLLLGLAWRGAWRPESRAFSLRLALLVVVSLVVAPHLYAHDLVLLIPVAFYVARYAVETGLTGRALTAAKSLAAVAFVAALLDGYPVVTLPVRPLFVALVAIGWSIFTLVRSERER